MQIRSWYIFFYYDLILERIWLIHTSSAGYKFETLDSEEWRMISFFVRKCLNRTFSSVSDDLIYSEQCTSPVYRYPERTQAQNIFNRKKLIYSRFYIKKIFLFKLKVKHIKHILRDIFFKSKMFYMI